MSAFLEAVRRAESEVASDARLALADNMRGRLFPYEVEEALSEYAIRGFGEEIEAVPEVLKILAAAWLGGFTIGWRVGIDGVRP